MEYVQKETVPYFTDYEQLVTGLGYKLVDLQIVHQKSLWLVKAVIYSKNGVGIDDCSKVHRALLSRAEVLLNSQDIQMEVSSPGLNRVIKNAARCCGGISVLYRRKYKGIGSFLSRLA